MSVMDLETELDPARVLPQIRPGAALTVCGVLRRKDGRSVPVEVRLVQVTYGKEARILGVARDITERIQAEDGRRRLVEQLLVTQDRWRRQLARELHDELGQLLTSLSVGLSGLEVKASNDALADVRRLRSLTDRSIQEVHRITRGLHPVVLDELGLVAAVRRFAEDSLVPAGIDVGVEVQGLDEGDRLEAEAEASLFRVLQEALTNVAKHASASTVGVVIHRQPDRVRCIVEDDGQGMELVAEQRFPDSRGLGLVGMHERISLLGGDVSIETAPGSGTTLYVELPLPIRPSPSTA